MAKRIYGFLTDVLAGEPQWVAGDGEAIAANAVRARDDIVLFVPGEDVSVLSAAVPVRSGPQAREAAAYSVEDEIAVNVEDEHVVLGAAGEDLKAARSIHVVAAQKMTEWTRGLQDKPALASAALVAAPSVLPPGTVLNIDGTWLAHIDGRAFSVRPDMPAGLAEALIGQAEVSAVAVDDGLAALAKHAEAKAELVDLRQGGFQARASARLQDFRAWRTSALLAAAIGLVWIGSSLLQIRALNQETDALNARMAEAYQTAFPGASERTNYVRSVGRELSARGASQIDFRDASAALYTALDSLPNAELRAIRFDEANTGFVARIAYSAYGEDAQLKAALAEAGFAATLGALRQEGTRVVGEVVFGGSG